MKQLKKERVWGVWRREVNAKGELTKVPHVATSKGDIHARVDDARNWCDFDTAQKRVEPGGFEGLAFRIADSTLAAIDIDGASHKGGSGRNPLEEEVCAMFAATYREQSPSGDGIHIIFRVKPEFLPHAIDEHGKMVWDSEHYTMNNGAAGLEFYAGAYTKKYFTFTGRQLSDGDTLTDCTDAACEFMEKFMRKPESGQASSAQAAQTGAPLTHEQIQERLEIARRAKDGEKFMRLYDEGNTADYGGDDSAADAGLCVLLGFWLNREPAAIDEAFRGSKLYRKKWDERHGRDTYGALTIEAANLYALRKGIGVYVPAGQDGFKYRPRMHGDNTEEGQADLFAELYGDKLRYCSALGWLCWDGRVWQQDDNSAMAMVQELSRLQFEEARQYVLTTIKASEDGKPSADAETYRRFALKMRSKHSLDATLYLAQSKLPIKACELDSDAYVLNTPGGLVDLRTGEISPHRAEAYCTRITRCAPSGKGGQVWREFLDLVSGGNIEWQAFLQAVAGMAAIGRVTDEKLIIAHGEGARGKSTTFNALQRVMGSYAGTFDVDLLTQDFRGNVGAQLAALRGVRLAICSELEAGQKLSVKMMKRLASANATLQIEMKYHAPEEIVPTHTIIMHTNNKPRILADDDGTWRRPCVLPFTVDMPKGAEKIVNYDDVLVEQAGEAIMQWIVEGARDFYADGEKLNLPACVVAADAEYRHGEHCFQDFINACCEVGDRLANVTAKELYAAFVDWACTNCKGTLMSKGEMNAELEKMGFSKTTPQRRPVWHGIRLKSEQE